MTQRRVEAAAAVVQDLWREQLRERLVLEVGDQHELAPGREAVEAGREAAEQDVEVEGDSPRVDGPARLGHGDRLDRDPPRVLGEERRVSLGLEDVESSLGPHPDEPMEELAEEDAESARVDRANLAEVEPDSHSHG